MTRNSTTFQKALGLLAHPACLSAMGIMLLNDLVLRRFAPSWWTGKLSDAAYLFFVPFALAALLAWLLPRQSERRVRALAFTLAALAFTLGKLHPAVNAAAGEIIQSALGIPVRIVADPTDLLALPALGAAWLLWGRRPDTPRLPAQQPARWLLLPLAAFLTLANSAPPSYGVTCLSVEEGRIVASGYYDSWSSADGGLTWKAGASSEYSPFCREETEEKVLEIPGENASYRYETGAIERSDDGGATWQLAFDPPPYRQPERAYMEKTTSAGESYTPTPIDAAYDPASGNAVFSMGHQGVLVRTASGEWRWSSVGPYRRQALQQDGLPGYFVLLQGELLLTAAAALVIFGTLAWFRLPRRWHRTARLVLGWLLFAFAAAVVPPAITTEVYISMVAYFALLAAVVWAFANAAIEAVALARAERSALGRTALFSLWAIPAYLFPYLLWAANLLPYYHLAALLAGILLAAALVMGRSRAAGRV